jgi:putative ABC transport system permease protein
VKGVTKSDRSFGSGRSSTTLQKPDGELTTIRFLRVDEDYLRTLGLELLRGRNFEPGETARDSIPLILVNETLVRTLELDDPVGYRLRIDGEDMTLEIIGMVKDFHFDSMHDEIQSLVMHTYDFNTIWYLFVKADVSQMADVLEHCEKCWKEVVPEFNWEYRFLDDIMQDQYKTEDRWSRIIAYAAAIAIFLSCLGLMGISGLMVARRYKEISIRKVNGATLSQVILLLNADILRWILVSYVIACPAAWFAMHRWLRDFAFRITLSWWIFAFAGLAAFFISVLTVTLQIFRIARQNPVKSLRYE